MPGFDQQAADLVARTMLQGGLGQYMQVAQKLAYDQASVINELSRRLFKPKSVFRNITMVENLANYGVVGADPATAAWQGATGVATGSQSVFVFSLDDADVVRLTATAFQTSSAPIVTPLIIGWALTPNQGGNSPTPIALNQFALVSGASDTYGIVSTNKDQLINVSEEIPCSGNRYIHIFAALGNQDFITANLPIPALGNFLTLSLIK